MSKPLVSVVIITYNQEKYLAAAIESVLNQEVSFKYEVIIGEDCSTDGTREIVSTYQRRHPNLIRVITSDRNVGMVRNFVRTSRACAGTFLAFCEGDDYWHRRDKLQLQVQYLENHADCGLVCSNFDVKDVTKGTVIKNFLTYKKWEVAETFRLADWVSDTTTAPVLTLTVMLRRNVFEKVINADPYLYDSDSFLMYDWQLWAEIAEVSNVGYISDSLATYNVSKDSVNPSKDIEKALRFSVSGCEAGLYLCKKYGLAEGKKMGRQQALWSTSLDLARYTRNKSLAEDIKREMSRMSHMDRFRYLSTRSSVINSIYVLLRVAKRILA